MIFAFSWLARLRGLKAHKDFKGVLALMPCRDVHTFGMDVLLDIAFVSTDGEVLRSLRKVQPNRRIRCPGAAFTLERYAKESEWPEQGSFVSFGWLEDLDHRALARERSK